MTMQDTDGNPAGARVMNEQQDPTPCVLVVRSDGLADRVGAAFAGARLAVGVESQPSYLSAMGWLSHHHADVIIGPVSAMTGMVGSTARSLRRMSPTTRLIAVADPDERAEAEVALSAGFDEVVYEPADATALLASLRLAPADDPPMPPLQTETPSADPVSAPAAEPEPEEATRSEIDWLNPMFESAPDASALEQIGDVDLAEAVMRGNGSLVPLAMRLLREQSGVADAAFADQSELPANPRVCHQVVFSGHELGVLYSNDTKAEALGSWAAWLARWVALDRRQADLYAMAMRDELTGLWNRRYFDHFLDRVLRHAGDGRQQVTLLLFDIDNFKQYNDTFGHPAGDEILRSAASLIQSLVREHDVVARIGGDEFAVIFWDKGEPRHLGSQHPDNVIGIAKRFQKAICEHRFPTLSEQAVGQLTVSGGLAGFPWDGRTPDELVARADAMAIQSKRQGKNAICFGPGAAPNGGAGTH